MSYLKRMFRRSGDVDRIGQSGWYKLAADVLGPLMEVSWRMFGVLLLGAAIIPVARGRPWDDLLFRLFALGASVGILGLLASQIVRTTYEMVLWRHGRIRLVVCPVAAVFFLVDALWLAFGAVWLRSSARAVPVAGIAPDPAYAFGGPAIVLAVSASLLGLRIWSRIRAE